MSEQQPPQQQPPQSTTYSEVDPQSLLEQVLEINKLRAQGKPKDELKKLLNEAFNLPTVTMDTPPPPPPHKEKKGSDVKTAPLVSLRESTTHGVSCFMDRSVPIWTELCYYDGKDVPVVTDGEFLPRAAQHHDGKLTRIGFDTPRFPDGLGQLINDSDRPHFEMLRGVHEEYHTTKNIWSALKDYCQRSSRNINCSWGVNPDKEFAVYSTKPIAKDEELYAFYGVRYWLDHELRTRKDLPASWRAALTEVVQDHAGLHQLEVSSTKPIFDDAFAALRTRAARPVVTPVTFAKRFWAGFLCHVIPKDHVFYRVVDKSTDKPLVVSSHNAIWCSNDLLAAKRYFGSGKRVWRVKTAREHLLIDMKDAANIDKLFKLPRFCPLVAPYKTCNVKQVLEVFWDKKPEGDSSGISILVYAFPGDDMRRKSQMPDRVLADWFYQAKPTGIDGFSVIDFMMPETFEPCETEFLIVRDKTAGGNNLIKASLTDEEICLIDDC